jgi:hypothetical protein
VTFGLLVLAPMMGCFPRMKCIWADSSYKEGGHVKWINTTLGWVVEIVGRTFVWLSTWHRLSKDFDDNNSLMYYPGCSAYLTSAVSAAARCIICFEWRSLLRFRCFSNATCSSNEVLAVYLAEADV